MLKFITVDDLTTNVKGEDYNRTMTLAYGGRTQTPGTLCVLGGLLHDTEITFNRANAIKLANWLQDTIIRPKR